MKEKLLNAFGTLGGILWFIVSTLVYVLPFVMIGASFWLNLLFFGIVQFIPASSVVFWIWGLIRAIQGQQDVWAITYYVLFAVLFLPFFVSTICDIFNSLKSIGSKKHKPTNPQKQSDSEPPKDRPDVYISWRD